MAPSSPTGGRVRDGRTSPGESAHRPAGAAPMLRLRCGHPAGRGGELPTARPRCRPAGSGRFGPLCDTWGQGAAVAAQHRTTFRSARAAQPPRTHTELDRGEPSSKAVFLLSQPKLDPATFASLGVPAALVAMLTKRGINSPFPIQTATLPDTLAGRDVLGRGRTGSGKTLAFALPVVARLAHLVPSASGIAQRTQPGRPRGLILAPTRELANQIHRIHRAAGHSCRAHRDDHLRRGQPAPSGAGAAPRCRHRGGDPRSPRGPDGPGPGPPGRGRDHHPRRGRPHGRPRLPARRHPHPRRHARRRAADAVLGHPGQRRRQARQAVPQPSAGAQRRQRGLAGRAR